MHWNDVIGQHATRHQLVQLVQQNRLSHALLFVGNEGRGVLPLAIAFAQYLVALPSANKANATPDLFGGPATESTQTETIPAPEAIFDTPAYQRATQLIHPDLHFSFPVIPRKTGDKPVSTDYASEWRAFIAEQCYGNVYDWLQFIGAENKQGNITAAECADIQRKLSLKTFESDYKVLVMWMPEYLGNEGNKLLKLIEEPPANTIFILAAENESLILPTILSRCQIIRIPPLSTTDIAEALIEKGLAETGTAEQIAAVSEGNFREAYQLLQNAEDDWQALLREWLNALMKYGPAAQVTWVEKINQLGREKQKQFIRYFNHLLEQAIRLRVFEASPDQQPIMPEKERDFALRLNKITGLAEQKTIMEELDKTSYAIERNANAKIQFLALSIKLYHLIADKSLILIT
ncbi:MAG: ATP-binding protein [Chitinophagaceae bacterium]